MNSRSSQPFIWISVALLTAALYAGAIKWGKVTFHFPEKPPRKIALVDLTFIEFTEPAPEPEPEPSPPTPTPPPEPEPTPPPPEPEPTPMPEPEPEPVKPPPPPEVEPTPPPKPKIDPAILRKEQEAKEAREREAKRQRDLAKKRLEEKRRQKLAAQKAAAARKKAEDAKRRADAARAAAAKRIVSKPSIVSRRKPTYPSSARRAGHQGTVTVSFTVSSSGSVTSVRVSRSSGHSSLDNAAISAVRRWRFKPARNGLGQATSYKYSIPIPFVLK